MQTKPYLRSFGADTTSVDSHTVLDGGPHTRRRISWAAIFGGVIVVVAIQLLLSTLGLGIGLGTVNVNAGTTPDASSLGISAGVWWVMTSCLALFLGSYVAAWLAGIDIAFDGLLHGLVTWGVATLLTVYLLTSAIGGIIAGGLSALGGVAKVAGSGISSAAQPLVQASGATPNTVQDQAQAFLEPANPDPATMTSQDAHKEVGKDLAIYARSGADAPAAKERIIDIMAVQTKISRDQAAQRFNDLQAKLQQAKDQALQDAKNAADESAAAASKTAFSVFGVLFLGAIAASIGGSLAVQHRLFITQRRGPIVAVKDPAVPGSVISERAEPIS